MGIKVENMNLPLTTAESERIARKVMGQTDAGNAPANEPLKDAVEFDADAPRGKAKVPGGIYTTTKVATETTVGVLGLVVALGKGGAMGVKLVHTAGDYGVQRFIKGKSKEEISNVRVAAQEASTRVAATEAVHRVEALVGQKYPADLQNFQVIRESLVEILSEQDDMRTIVENVVGTGFAGWANTLGRSALLEFPPLFDDMADGLLRAGRIRNQERGQEMMPLAARSRGQVGPDADPVQQNVQRRETISERAKRQLSVSNGALSALGQASARAFMAPGGRLSLVGTMLTPAKRRFTSADPIEPSDKFGDFEANGLVETWGSLGLMRANKAVTDWLASTAMFKNAPLTTDVVASYLKSGSLPPVAEGQPEVKFATILPVVDDFDVTANGTRVLKEGTRLPLSVHSQDGQARLTLALAQLASPLPEHITETIPATGLDAVLQIKCGDFNSEIADKVVNLVSVEDDANGKPVDASNFWSFMRSVIVQGEAGWGQGAIIDDMPAYEFLATNNVPTIHTGNAAFDNHINAFFKNPPEKQRDAIRRFNVLANLGQVAGQYYGGGAELDEAAVDLLKGAVIGLIYELAGEKVFKPDPKKPFYESGLWYVNALGATVVDAIDNILGRGAAATIGLQAKRKGTSVEHIFGPGASNAPFVEQVVRWPRLVWNGGLSKERLQDLEQGHGVDNGMPDRETAARFAGVGRSGMMGALLGLAIQFPAQIPLSEAKPSKGQLIGATAGGTVGTSLSIPIEQWSELLNKLKARQALMEKGVLNAGPDESFKKALDECIREINNALDARSSNISFWLAPTLALLWLFLKADYSNRDVLQALVFGLGPGFENLLTLVFAALTKMGFKQGQEDFTKANLVEALQSVEATLSEEDHASLAQKVADIRAQHANEYASALDSAWSRWLMTPLAVLRGWLPFLGMRSTYEKTGSAAAPATGVATGVQAADTSGVRPRLPTVAEV